MSAAVLFYGAASFVVAYFATGLVLAIFRGRLIWTRLDRFVAAVAIVVIAIFINLMLLRLDLFGATP